MAPAPTKAARPKLAVWKFASCDGCQLTVLDCGPALLKLAAAVDIAMFLEASSAMVPGPYDLSLVEGSIITTADAQRIRRIRRQSKRLVTIGACATAGGIQALRNFQDKDRLVRAVYPRPEMIHTLATSTPIRDHVEVDYELRGCPIDRGQLLQLVTDLLAGHAPALAHHSQCVECKLAGTVCVTVAHGIPCLGPVTQAGCGNLCPRLGRGCYGCFGPMETPNTAALARRMTELGRKGPEIRDAFRSFNAGAEPFRRESQAHE